VAAQLLTLELTTKLIAFEVATKLISHRRQETIRKVVFSAGAEPLKERRSQDRRRGCALDGRMGRPPPLAGIRHATGKLLQVGLLGQRFRREIEEPRANDASASPHFSHVGQGEVVLIVLGMGGVERSRHPPAASARRCWHARGC
jgi:hypothetical protein